MGHPYLHLCLPAADLGMGWEDGGAALAQGDPGMVWEFAGTSEDNLVSVQEEGSDFTGGKLDGICSVTGEFQKTAGGGFGRTGDCSGGEDVSGLEIAAVACVVGYELGRGPIKIARAASAKRVWFEIICSHGFGY